MQASLHQSVLLDEAITALAVKPGGIYIDGTFGRGGHSQAILAKAPGKLIVIDKDATAIAYAKQHFSNYNTVRMYHDSFANCANIASLEQVTGQVDGILLDLGLASPQVDEAARGFSFQQDGPLDMRMDQTRGEPLSLWINQVAEKTLAEIIFKYGEEKAARAIARAIIAARQQHPVTTTKALADIISKIIPYHHKHPATRTFQALRIFINQELRDLEQFLETVTPILAPGGRLAIISFHSLEDRIVKHWQQQVTQPQRLPRHLPISQTDLPSFTCCIKMHKPNRQELKKNPRARSAILRVVEKQT